MNNQLTKEQQELVEKNHNLIYGFANKNKLNIEEYYGILAIGLCKAAKVYEENKNEFSTLAYNCMKNEIYKYWKHIKIKSAIPNEMILSYDAQIDTGGVEGEFSYLNAISDNYAINNTIENKIFEGDFLNQLSQNEKIVVKLLVKDLTYTEIAKRMGCTRQRVGQYVQKIRKKYIKFVDM